VSDARRHIPRTDRLLADPRIQAAQARLGHRTVRAVVNDVQERARRGELEPEHVADAVLAALPAFAGSLRPVLNATGVLVHTNLGRAPLSAASVQAIVRAAGTTDVELELASGRRGRRGAAAVRALAAAVPDAEDVHVVNNNAAALVLVATSLARDREIVVSRGELVEIGDGFRIPDLLAATGARLREVGTTNRTSVADYEAAMGDDTALVLKVHPSNFVVQGFVSSVDVAALAQVCRGSGVPLVVDIGSGLLAPHPSLPDEPDARTALRAGADLVTASGDKLLGGPQCGLLLGRADLVGALRRHPLARALRLDKLTLAALEATLRGPEPPVLAMLAADPAELLARAAALAARLAGIGVTAHVVDCSSAVGGGGAPGVAFASAAIGLPPSYAQPLRLGDPAVVGRIERGMLLLDLRTVDPADDETVCAAVRRVASA
jgi:L-seryl-tRNA(Ser) seleniumtransferase